MKVWRMQAEMSNARQFVLVKRCKGMKPEQVFVAMNRVLKSVSEQGFEAQRMDKADMVDKQNFKFSDIIGKCIRPGREPLDYHMWEYNNKPEWYTPISLTDKARIADTVMDYAEMYVGQSMTGQGMSM